MRKFSFLLLAMIITVCLATMAFAETEPTKWQPQYGEKGELLNPEPSISFYRTTSPQHCTALLYMSSMY